MHTKRILKSIWRGWRAKRRYIKSLNAAVKKADRAERNHSMSRNPIPWDRKKTREKSNAAAKTNLTGQAAGTGTVVGVLTAARTMWPDSIPGDTTSDLAIATIFNLVLVPLLVKWRTWRRDKAKKRYDDSTLEMESS